MSISCWDGATSWWAYSTGIPTDSRAVIVVGPDGRIAGVIPQFNQNDPTAYEQLGQMVDSVTPESAQ